MKHTVEIGDIRIGSGCPLVLIAGPCVIEAPETTFAIAAELKTMTDRLDIPLIFKASYDKANRSSIRSYRGPGIDEGLRILGEIRAKLNVPIISDVHHAGEVEQAARVLDVLQLPAFLCRQTDFVLAASRSGKPVNIKKGQFMAPWDMANVVEKFTSTGNRNLLLTERGAMFGYNNLVVDFRSIPIMQRIGWPVIFDATHSVQLPGGDGTCSGGQREFAPLLAKAAVAAGADGLFIEVHSNPDQARCDGPNSLKLEDLPAFLSRIKALHTAATT